MTGHFEVIGFKTEDRKDFEQLGIDTADNGVKIDVSGTPFEYRQWRIGNGIELWVAIKNGKEIRCFSPYYSSSKKIEIVIIEEVTDNDCDFCRGYYATRPDSQAAGDMPIIFHMPDSYLTRRKVKHNTLYPVELCGFAENIRYFENEELFNQVSDGFSTDYYIPSGTFSPRDDDKEFKQNPRALLAGRIRGWRRIINPMTEQSFFHLNVDNSFGDLDVIVKTSDIKGELIEGGIIEGRFWFTGKIIL